MTSLHTSYEPGKHWPQPLGDRTEIGIDQLDILMPREPKVHEPLPIQQPSHLLQHLNSPPVVFDQIFESCLESAREISTLTLASARYWND